MWKKKKYASARVTLASGLPPPCAQGLNNYKQWLSYQNTQKKFDNHRFLWDYFIINFSEVKWKQMTRQVLVCLLFTSNQQFEFSFEKCRAKLGNWLCQGLIRFFLTELSRLMKQWSINCNGWMYTPSKMAWGFICGSFHWTHKPFHFCNPLLLYW